MLWFKNLVSGMNLWLPAFAVNILFQVLRHAYVDAMIFSIAAILMILEWKKLLPLSFGARPVFRLRWIILVIVSSATVLYVNPRHSVQDDWVLIAVLPIAVLLTYYNEEHITITYDKPLRRSLRSFMGLGIFLAVVELAAYVISDRVHNSEDFPTVSFLVSPTLEHPEIRFIFLGLWMSMGVGLMQVLRGRKVVQAVDHAGKVGAAKRDLVLHADDDSEVQP